MWVISDRLKSGQLGNWLEEKILPALELRWRPRGATAQYLLQYRIKKSQIPFQAFGASIGTATKIFLVKGQKNRPIWGGRGGGVKKRFVVEVIRQSPLQPKKTSISKRAEALLRAERRAEALLRAERKAFELRDFWHPRGYLVPTLSLAHDFGIVTGEVKNGRNQISWFFVGIYYHINKILHQVK